VPPSALDEAPGSRPPTGVEAFIEKLLRARRLPGGTAQHAVARARGFRTSKPVPRIRLRRAGNPACLQRSARRLHTRSQECAAQRREAGGLRSGGHCTISTCGAPTYWPQVDRTRGGSRAPALPRVAPAEARRPLFCPCMNILPRQYYRGRPAARLSCGARRVQAKPGSWTRAVGTPPRRAPSMGRWPASRCGRMKPHRGISAGGDPGSRCTRASRASPARRRQAVWVDCVIVCVYDAKVAGLGCRLAHARDRRGSTTPYEYAVWVLLKDAFGRASAASSGTSESRAPGAADPPGPAAGTVTGKSHAPRRVNRLAPSRVPLVIFVTRPRR
jgi:hypothetical protein